MTITTGGPPSPGALEAQRRGGLSIRDFLTDGSLASLCAALSALTDVDVQLRDERGLRITTGDGDTPWAILDEASSGPVPDGALRVPIEIEGHLLGEIVVPADAGASLTPHVLGVVRAMSAAAREVVSDVLELQHRVKELGVLHRLSSLLAGRSTTPETMLQVALDSAMEVLELDAGSIVLLPEDASGLRPGESESDLLLKASQNLSPEWLANPLPLSRGRLFDQIVLSGEVLAVEDLRADGRVLAPERCAAEGVRSFLSAAMIFRDRPIGVIRLYGRAPRRFTPMDMQLLRSIGEQAATAVQQARLLRVQKHERRMQRQLEMAGEVQSRMLPSALPRLGGLDAAARSIASAGLAGDFYDVFEHARELHTVIGDVVGKGVAAALLMSAVRAGVRSYTDGWDPRSGEPLEAVMTRVNAAVCRDTLDNEFVTLWHGVIDPKTLEMRACSAGHEPPFIVRRPADGRPPGPADLRPLGVGGLVLGVDPRHAYRSFQHRLERGDTLVLFTDGLTDARDFDDHKFGWERLSRAVLEILADEPAASAERIVEHVLWSLRRFAGLRDQVDDETLVVVRVEE